MKRQSRGGTGVELLAHLGGLLLANEEVDTAGDEEANGSPDGNLRVRGETRHGLVDCKRGRSAHDSRSVGRKRENGGMQRPPAFTRGRKWYNRRRLVKS